MSKASSGGQRHLETDSCIGLVIAAPPAHPIRRRAETGRPPRPGPAPCSGAPLRRPGLVRAGRPGGVPAASSATRPASLSRRRCRDTAGRLIGSSSAICCTERGRSDSSSRTWPGGWASPSASSAASGARSGRAAAGIRDGNSEVTVTPELPSPRPRRGPVPRTGVTPASMAVMPRPRTWSSWTNGGRRRPCGQVRTHPPPVARWASVKPVEHRPERRMALRTR